MTIQTFSFIAFIAKTPHEFVILILSERFAEQHHTNIMHTNSLVLPKVKASDDSFVGYGCKVTTSAPIKP